MCSATKIRSSQKEGTANSLALRLVQQLCHLKSRENEFLKITVSFPLSQHMWGTWDNTGKPKSDTQGDALLRTGTHSSLSRQGGLQMGAEKESSCSPLFLKEEKGREASPRSRKTQFTVLLCHLLEVGKNFLPRTPDCRTYIPIKPKHENVMLMFKAKLTSTKFFDISSLLMNSGQKNYSWESFCCDIFYRNTSSLIWMEADIILSIQHSKQAKNTSITSRTWSKGWLLFSKIA